MKQISYGAGQNALIFLGRVLISALFILSGVQKLANWSQTLSYVQSSQIMWAPGMLAIATALELVGGILLLLGWRARLGSLLLLLFLVPTTYLMHAYWKASIADIQMQQIHFMKNVAIIGGLLILLGSGPGQWAVDRSKS